MVEAFNRVWADARLNVPFYREWQRVYCLPDAISSLDELTAWPILRKADLRNLELFRRVGGPRPCGEIMTGGSTGEPVHLPVWHRQGMKEADRSIWEGRKAYGVRKGDRLFLLWGHQHLYGKGARRLVLSTIRRVKDFFRNYVRVSAYDLSAEAMRGAMRVFERSGATWVMGFSPAVLAFVRHNPEKRGTFTGIKMVLCTAGPLTADEQREIATFFGAPIAMEYGSVECQAIAYTRPSDGKYHVFTRTHLVQTVQEPEGHRAIITRLEPLCVPLLRYDLGDYLDLGDGNAGPSCACVEEFVSVIGRPSEIVNFACGVSFFGALVGDCVKQVREVVSSQMAVDEAHDRLEIRVTATRRLTGEELELIKNRFSLVVRDAEKLRVEVVQMDKLPMSVGGKVQRIVRGSAVARRE